MLLDDPHSDEHVERVDALTTNVTAFLRDIAPVSVDRRCRYLSRGSGEHGGLWRAATSSAT